MNRNRTLVALIVAFGFAAGVAHASWYDDYDAGLAAVRKGNWSAAVQKMSAAIKGNPKESDKARTYGVITINYHPYYYRAVANLNLGKYEEAISDFEKTSGPGPENLGSLDVLMERAKKQLAAAEEPEPSRPEPSRPAPAVTQPAAPSPAVPQVDPSLRQRANAALAGAKQKIQAAQARKAGSSPQFSQATSMFSDATVRNANARSNDDLQSVISIAESAGDMADLASAPSAAPAAPAPSVATSKPAVAAENVLADYRRQLRGALEHYFNGDFEEATRDFEALSRRLPNNGWIFAFLGASQYSRYAFEADPAYRSAAIKSFQKVKQLRTFKGGLPERYFSRRIRKAFAETSG